LQEWFANVLRYSEVATLAGPYSDLASIAGATLDMVASARGIALSSGHRSRILQGMADPSRASRRSGRSTDDATQAEARALTDSAPAAVQQQLANAGLTSFFEGSFSVETVRHFKPAPEPYQSVADSLGLPPDRLRLVAALAWDIVGALRAGYAAAFVARPGKVLYPLGPKPDITGPDFKTVAELIVAAETI